MDGCPECGASHDLQGLPTRYAYLLGMYLGDGCISRHRREVFKLRITLDARYPEIVSACEDAIQELVPLNKVARVNRGTWWELYAYSKTWPCLFPQHGPGRKHERAIVLTDWQWEAVSQRPDPPPRAPALGRLPLPEHRPRRMVTPALLLRECVGGHQADLL